MKWKLSDAPDLARKNIKPTSLDSLTGHWKLEKGHAMACGRGPMSPAGMQPSSPVSQHVAMGGPTSPMSSVSPMTPTPQQAMVSSPLPTPSPSPSGPVMICSASPSIYGAQPGLSPAPSPFPTRPNRSFSEPPPMTYPAYGSGMPSLPPVAAFSSHQQHQHQHQPPPQQMHPIQPSHQQQQQQQQQSHYPAYPSSLMRYRSNSISSDMCGSYPTTPTPAPSPSTSPSNSGSWQPLRFPFPPFTIPSLQNMEEAPQPQSRAHERSLHSPLRTSSPSSPQQHPTSSPMTPPQSQPLRSSSPCTPSSAECISGISRSSSDNNLLYNNPLSNQEEPLFHLFTRPTPSIAEAGSNGHSGHASRSRSNSSPPLPSTDLWTGGNPMRTTTRTTTTTEVTETTEIERCIVRNRSRSHSNPDPPHPDVMEMSHQQPQQQPAHQPQQLQRRLAVHRPTRLRSQSTPTPDGWVMPAEGGNQADAMQMAEDNNHHLHQQQQQQHQHQHRHPVSLHQPQQQQQRHDNGGQKGKMDIGFLVSS